MKDSIFPDLKIKRLAAHWSKVLYIVELEIVHSIPHEKLKELIGGLDRRGHEYYLRNVTEAIVKQTMDDILDKVEALCAKETMDGMLEITNEPQKYQLHMLVLMRKVVK